MDYDRTFTLDGNFYPLKAFILEGIYLGELYKVFRDEHREKKMGLSLKPDEKNKNWMEKKNECINTKSAANKDDTKSEETDD